MKQKKGLQKPNKYVRIRKGMRRRKVWDIFLACILVLYGIGGYYAYNYWQSLLIDMPDLNTSDFISEESSRIYDSRGTLLTEIGTYYRENITYDQCPEALVDAFLSIEDSRFFEHNGFDIPRFTKAAIANLQNKDYGQGGSTFTMQLVKNTYFTIEDGELQTERTKSIAYKAQQIVLSTELEKQLSKQQIFQLYVNKLNFGGRVRGVQKAAEYYFGKNVTDLNLAESAMLAGIVNLPNAYNPYAYLDFATDRRNEVLDAMAYHGYISQEQCDLAKSIKVEDELVGEHALNTESTIYPSYLDAVIAEAQEMTGLDPTSTGMRIYTALVPEIQNTIESIQNETYDPIQFPDSLMQIATISINNKTGEIVAIGGGRGYNSQSGQLLLNRATQAYKQPGSSIKPVLDYALAFEYLGYSMDEILLDKPITFPAEARVLVNATGKYQGDITIKDAVATSLNIPAILTLEDVTAKIGSEAIVRYANEIGFSKLNDDEFHMSYAIGGNQFTTTVKELAGAHAAMINLGVYNEPHTIVKIETSTGDTYLPKNQNVHVLSSGSAYLTDQLMQNNVDCGIFNFMQVLKRGYPVYAKTGTTDWGEDGLQYGYPEGASKDKWMVASTSQYTNAVWLGYDYAVAGEQCWFPMWKQYLNISGKTMIALLDTEETVSPDTIGGVERPADVQDVTYYKGTYPHILATGSGGNVITSQVSDAGLRNEPMQPASNYNSSNKLVLSGFTAAVANGLLYVNWNVPQPCSGSRDISLHDEWGNNVSQSGRCLVSTANIVPKRSYSYSADIYIDDQYVTSVKGKDGKYTGMPAQFSGTVKVCGYYGYNRLTSNTQCVNAGEFDSN